jgi:hypothetical protein
MTAQPAISIWSTEDGRRCIPPYIRVDRLANVFDWLKLSPETWAKMKVKGIPPHIERELEIRFCVLESFRQSQKLASSAARNPESHHYEENGNPDYEFASIQSEPNDYDESIDHPVFTSKPSLQAAIEKIESPRRTRMLIAAMLDNVRVPSIDCGPIKSYRLYDEILRLLCARSTNVNSIAAKDLVFHLLVDAGRYRKNGNIDLALELEFLASAIDLIAYRNDERPTHAKKLWF